MNGPEPSSPKSDRPFSHETLAAGARGEVDLNRLARDLFNHGHSPLAPWLDRVTRGDCLQVLRLLPSASIDLVVTDPPYAVRYQDQLGRRIHNDDNTRWLHPAFSELFRVLRDDTFCVSFYGWTKVDRFVAAWRDVGFRPVGHFTFVKAYASKIGYTAMRHENAFLLAKGRPLEPANPPPDVIPWRYAGNTLHPTQKPVSILKPLVQAYSKEGDVVLDPFAGSGSTGVAALRTNRRFILVEQDETYHGIAAERLRSLQADRSAMPSETPP
jgi:adenine-specific DNA-methyltransferase